MIHVNDETICKAGLLVFLVYNIKYHLGLYINSNQTTGRTPLLSTDVYLSFSSEYFDFRWLISACVHLAKKMAVNQMDPAQRV